MPSKSTSPQSGGETKADPADLAAQMAELRADMEKLTALIGEMSTAKTEGLFHRMQQGARDLGGDLGGDTQAMLQDGKAEIEAKLAELADYARKKPFHALAWAAGAGLVFGLIFGRR